MKISVLNAGGQPDYLFGFVSGLLYNGIQVDVVDGTKTIQIFKDLKGIKHYNFRGSEHSSNTKLFTKLFKLYKYYFLLVLYPIWTRNKIFHIQWDNKFVFFDRVFLNLWYKLFGKKIIYTAHNVNPYQRDNNASFLKILSLKLLYRIVDHIIVHTDQMRQQLISEFHISSDKISICLHGINNLKDSADYSKEEARASLGISKNAKVLLFFGQIGSYKGLDILLESVSEIKDHIPELLLIVRGQPKNCNKYINDCIEIIESRGLSQRVNYKFSFVDADEVPLYFVASDVLCMPYRHIFQSGVLFMSLKYGLPVLVTDVGNFKNDIELLNNGMVVESPTINDFSNGILNFFESNLYLDKDVNSKIKKTANEIFSWDKIGKCYSEIYKKLI